MLKYSFFVLLSFLVAPLTLCARHIALTDATIPYKSVTSLQDIVCDAVVALPDVHELETVKSSYINPKDLNDSKKIFVGTVLKTLNSWITDYEKTNQYETTKHLGVLTTLTKSPENLIFIVECILNKHTTTSQTTLSLTILGEASSKPIYLQNLLKAALTSQEQPSELVENIIIIGALVAGTAFFGRRTYTESNWYFFSECAKRLETLSRLLPRGVLTVNPQQKNSNKILFSTQTREDITHCKERNPATGKQISWAEDGKIDWEIRRRKDLHEHSSNFVVYNNKCKLENPHRTMSYKRPYELNTPDDFTVLIIILLLCRKIDVGPALKHFAKIITSHRQRSENIMTWLESDYQYGSLLNALAIYEEHRSLDTFFSLPSRARANSQETQPTRFTSVSDRIVHAGKDGDSD